jgi:hypothetical protein
MLRVMAQGQQQGFGLVREFVGFLACLAHEVGLEVDQVVGGLQVIRLCFAQLSLHQCHDLGLLVLFQQIEELVLRRDIGHAGGLDPAQYLLALVAGNGLFQLVQVLGDDLALGSNRVE